jgi:hypothetical protein
MIGRPNILPGIHRRLPMRPGQSCTTHARFVSMTATRASIGSDQSDHGAGDLPARKYLEISIRSVGPSWIDAIKQPTGRGPDQPGDPSLPHGVTR